MAGLGTVLGDSISGLYSLVTLDIRHLCIFHTGTRHWHLRSRIVTTPYRLGLTKETLRSETSSHHTVGTLGVLGWVSSFILQSHLHERKAEPWPHDKDYEQVSLRLLALVKRSNRRAGSPGLVSHHHRCLKVAQRAPPSCPQNHKSVSVSTLQLNQPKKMDHAATPAYTA
jgi:hypothetical protein